jgi:predicted MFS family arabinose efflux permease
MVGTPIALSLGVPAGAFLGAMVGWRVAFFAMSATTLVLIGWVVWAVPDFAGQSAHRRLSLKTVITTPGIRPILATILAWMTAHNILYTYVAPFAVLSGLQGRVDLLLLTFGIAALVGIWVTGLLVDRMLRRLVLVSLIAFAGVALAFGLFATVPAVVIAGIVLWGLSFGGAATQLQTASADAASDGVDLANAMITTVWNSAIAAGGILGGILLDHLGAGAFGWAALALSLVALCIAFCARRHGFIPGPRAAS